MNIKYRAFIHCIFSLFLLICPAIIAGNIPTSDFEKWFVKTTKFLDTKGKVINTALGPIQIVTQGKGPPVLSLHGGFGGWDQGQLISAFLAEKGYKVISPSRPGYLATPIATDPLSHQETTAAQQADLMAALLDALDIPKVIVIGFSAGAPVAYELGLRHPDRIVAVVLECIGANPNEDGQFYEVLGEVLVTQTEEVDYNTYLLHLSLIDDYYSSALEFAPADTTLTGEDLEKRTNYVINHFSQYAFLRQMLIDTIPLSPRLLGTLNDFMGVDYWTNTFVPPSPAQYSLPTMIIQAINDSNGFYPTAVTVHQSLPSSQLISVSLSGHFIWLGPNTKTWQKQLVTFLKAQKF